MTTADGEVRIGVIGRGFGARVVAPVFQETDGCTVVDVVSPREDRAVAGLCSRRDVDLVCVHSPPFMHLEHVRRAVEGGHDVLCDKPFGRTVEEATAMCEAARHADRVHLLNFEMRFDPLRERLRALVRGGELGEAEHVHCNSLLSVSRQPLRRFGWLFDADLGGGWIGAWGSHFVDFVRWSLGEIVEVSAQRRTVIAERPDADGALRRCSAEDGFSAALRTETGVTVTVDSTSAAPVSLPSVLTVIGSDGVLELVDEQRIVRRDADGARDEPGTGRRGDPTGSMRRWAAVVRDAVRTGAAPPGAPTFADGLACREVLDRLQGITSPRTRR